MTIADIQSFSGPIADLNFSASGMTTMPLFYLKGLSHEIDFDNSDENWQMLALTRAAAGFFFTVNAKITPIAAVIRLILLLNSWQAVL
jgi:hypothetical protein